MHPCARGPFGAAHSAMTTQTKDGFGSKGNRRRFLSRAEHLWHGYVTDVTARQRAEEELREEKAHLRAFYDSGLLGVIYWNADGVIAEANDGFLEMLGYSREDLDRGRINWIKITPPEFLARDQAALEGIRANGSTKRPYETEYLRKNGERIPVLMAGSALDAGATKGVAFVLDISDRKRAEARLQTLYINRFDVMRNMAARFAHEITQPLTAAGAYSAAARRMLDFRIQHSIPPGSAKSWRKPREKSDGRGRSFQDCESSSLMAIRTCSRPIFMI